MAEGDHRSRPEGVPGPAQSAAHPPKQAAGPAGSAPAPPERLQKVLAKAGLGSRRRCEDLIADGRVTVNGLTAQLGQRADGARDRIAVDNIPLPGREGVVYYLVNKPVGIICSASDPQGRPIVTSLVPPLPRVFPVGRLDVSSEGLIVLTNDGDLAYQLTHPSFGVLKEYVVEVEGKLSREALGRLRRGVELDDGVTAPAKVSLLGLSTARIAIHEGRNRQVRRMCEALGHPVRRLVRTRIGPVSDPLLAPGAWRHLDATEVGRLWEAASAPVQVSRTGAPLLSTSPGLFGR
jgi:23S rRNA pseudouridine2605 synthase